MNKPSYPHPLIAREGWPFLAGSVLLALIISFFSGWASLPFWLIALFVLQFFRDPPRMAPEGRLNVLSPADGRIVAVEETQDPYANRHALKISVFMNVFNVHSNRVPVKGVVRGITYFPGKFLNASLDKASLENERNAMVMETPEGHTVTAVQVAGLVAKRILCYVNVGEGLYAGQRYGFIRFGSRVDVYLPPGSRVRVALGDKVQATSTVLAELPEHVDVQPDAPLDDANAESSTAESTTAESAATEHAIADEALVAQARPEVTDVAGSTDQSVKPQTGNP